MDDADDKPREWLTVTITLAAETRDELDAAVDDLADQAFLWAEQPVDAFARKQREAHVSFALGKPDWVACP